MIAITTINGPRRPAGAAQLVIYASLLALGSAAAFADAPAGAALALGPGSTLSLEGDSTLHRYSAKAQEFSASFVLGPAGGKPDSSVEALFRSGAIASAELVIPVEKLSSGEGGLDDNLRKALRGDTNKYILFHIQSYQLLAPTAAGSAFALALHGRLSVAGVGRDIEVTANGFVTPEGVRLSGSKDLLMSDYKVEAPVLMLGMLKTKDLVTISFNLLIESKP